MNCNTLRIATVIFAVGGLSACAAIQDSQVMKAEFWTLDNITSTTAWFKSLQVPNGAVAGFFRIHDSGDLSLPGVGDTYIEAWSKVVAAFPYVSFWCPTRIWASRKVIAMGIRSPTKVL